MNDAKTYELQVAGLTRQLPLCPINDKTSIAAFIMFSDVELTVACATELLKKVPQHDVILTAESKGIPLAYEMSRQSGVKYILARKSAKLYMYNPIGVDVKSITTARLQTLYLDQHDLEYLHGKRVLVVDDVISTGESLSAGGAGRQGRRHHCGPCGCVGGRRWPPSGTISSFSLRCPSSPKNKFHMQKAPGFSPGAFFRKGRQTFSSLGKSVMIETGYDKMRRTKGGGSRYGKDRCAGSVWAALPPQRPFALFIRQKNGFSRPSPCLDCPAYSAFFPPVPGRPRFFPFPPLSCCCFAFCTGVFLPNPLWTCPVVRSLCPARFWRPDAPVSCLTARPKAVNP